MVDTTDTALAVALDAAANLIRSLGESNLRAGAAASELEALAKVERVKGVSIPSESIETLTSLAGAEKRHGVTFLARASWLEGRDLFSFDPEGERALHGWRQPGTGDAAIMGSLRVFLRSSRQASDEADADTETNPSAGFNRLLSTVDRQDMDVLLAQPSFLPGVTLIHLALDNPMEPARPMEGFFFARDNEDAGLKVESFNYASDKVHFLSQSLRKPGLAGNELAYLRYFLQVVRGDAGAFRVIELGLLDRVCDLIEEDPATQFTAAELRAIWHPPVLVGAGPNGGLIYATFVIYSAALFQADFCVFAGGQVEMVADKQLTDPINSLWET